MPGSSDASHTSSPSREERDLRVEQTLLSEIITLPDRLTPEELILWMRGRSSDANRIEILDALSVLKRSGLVRQSGEVVEPTHAAIRADEIFNA
ncbi:MAG TPA: hypothetical protein VK471_01390 [Solirubrobacterales bacterium]|nr:hypothetical protein [Solirubrobacterales bacterium]